MVQFLLRHGAKPSLKDEDVSNRLLLTACVLSPSADTNLHCTTSCHIATVHRIVMLLADDVCVYVDRQDAAVSILMLVANAMQTMAAMLVT